MLDWHTTSWMITHRSAYCFNRLHTVYCLYRWTLPEAPLHVLHGTTALWKGGGVYRNNTCRWFTYKAEQRIRNNYLYAWRKHRVLKWFVLYCPLTAWFILYVHISIHIKTLILLSNHYQFVVFFLIHHYLRFQEPIYKWLIILFCNIFNINIWKLI